MSRFIGHPVCGRIKSVGLAIHGTLAAVSADYDVAAVPVDVILPS